MKIFISHSSVDGWVARQIARQLGDLGIETFLDDKDIESGDSIPEAVQQHLLDCDELLILLSPQALKSEWVLIEIGGAKVLGKRLVPILHHVGVNDLPAAISKHLARDLNEIDTYYRELGRRLKGEPKPPDIVEERSELRVGDLVRITTVPADDSSRPDIGWTGNMDTYCGRFSEITEVDDDRSARLDIDDGDNWWAFEWLRFVPTRNSYKPEDFHEGQRLRHERYGLGTVTRVFRKGNTIRLSVRFDSGKATRILARVAPIELLD